MSEGRCCCFVISPFLPLLINVLVNHEITISRKERQTKNITVAICSVDYLYVNSVWLICYSKRWR